MKTIKLIIILILIILPKLNFAQTSLIEAINSMPTESIPFDARNALFSDVWGRGVINPNNIIPDKLYDNVQLTEYTNASADVYAGGIAFRKFSPPNSNYTLLAVSFGGTSPYRTDVLCVINSEGEVISTLEGYVIGADVCIKQFRINSQRKIIVTTIKTTSASSIALTSFISFNGYRQDITYSVNTQGKFIQVSEQTFPTRMFNRSELNSESVNLGEM